MMNPWTALPASAPFVLPQDAAAIQAFNIQYQESPEFMVQTQLYPEPFVGSPSAAVYLLGLNPGYSSQDDELHRLAEFRETLLANLSHQTQATPYYYLDDRFAEYPGSRWSRQKLRWLIDEVSVEQLARNLMLVELFPYHSTRYHRIPKSISPSGMAPSADYSVHLVKQAMADGKLIIAMRAVKEWFKLAPGLESYENLHRLNSVQNISLSPRNLAAFDVVVQHLKRSTD